MAALGIDYEAIAKIAPRIVYTSITGYGQTGPRANLAGHDINYLGYAGVLDQTGARNGPPALSNLQIADLLGGAASAAIALLAALLDAQRTGRGRHIDVAMADASLAHNVMPLSTLDEWGALRPRGDDLLTGGVPCYGVYPTQDGRWLAVGALEQKFWKTLCASLERSDLVAHQFARGEEGARVRGELERIFAGAPLAAWVEKLATVDCCVTPIATLDEALADPQFAARAMVVTRHDGSHEYAPPFKLSRHAFERAARGAEAGRAQRASSARGRLRRFGDRRARRGGCGQDFLTGFAPPLRHRAHGQRGHARKFRVGEPRARGDVVDRHPGRVGAPEKLAADRERRHPEHAARNRFVGVAPQLVLDLRRGDSRVRRRRSRAFPRAPPTRSADPAAGRRATRT